MTEQLPIKFWTNDSDRIMDFVEIEVIDHSNLIGLKPTEFSRLVDGQYINGRAFPFEDYQWYLIPDKYLSIIDIPHFDSGIYFQNYILLQYHNYYWIAKRSLTYTSS